jgi:hypothetical protein
MVPGLKNEEPEPVIFGAIDVLIAFPLIEPSKSINAIIARYL